MDNSKEQVKDEIKEQAMAILNKGAIPFPKFRRAFHSNDLLSEEENQTLYMIALECEEATKKAEEVAKAEKRKQESKEIVQKFRIVT